MIRRPPRSTRTATLFPTRRSSDLTLSKRLQRRTRPNDQPTATLKDVSQHAGVSTATVSRVLNAQGKVNRETEARVAAAVAALGYVPHAAARALASRRSRTIGAVTAALDNPIFARGLQALEHRLELAGYGLLVASSNYEPARELKQVRTMVERGIDAIMLQGDSHLPEIYAVLQRKGIAYMNTWVYDAASPHPCCGFDNERAAHNLASYLPDHGHREITMVAGLHAGNPPPHNPPARVDADAGANRRDARRDTRGRYVESIRDWSSDVCSPDPRATAICRRSTRCCSARVSPT